MSIKAIWVFILIFWIDVQTIWPTTESFDFLDGQLLVQKRALEKIHFSLCDSLF